MGKNSRSYVQRLRIAGKPYQVGLGPTWATTLAEAREAAIENHRAARSGRHPRSPEMPTLSEILEMVIRREEQAWRGEGTAKLWRSQLGRYCHDIMSRPVGSITAKQIMTCLEECSPTIARANKQRINQIMKLAVVEGYRNDNPCDYLVLPKRNGHTEHRESLHYSKVGEVLSTIDNSPNWLAARLAVKMVIFVVARSNEVCGMEMVRG